jgi:hypothetical protein
MLQAFVQKGDAMFPSCHVVEQLALACPPEFFLIQQEASLDFYPKLGEANSEAGLFQGAEILNKAPQTARMKDDASSNFVRASSVVMATLV